MTVSNGDAPTKDTLMSRAYSTAARRLRENHHEEFNSYMVEETRKLGIEWTPRLSAEDRALQEITKLLESMPGLAERLAAKLATTTP